MCTFDQKAFLCCFSGSFLHHGIMKIIWTWPMKNYYTREHVDFKLKAQRQTLACHHDLLDFCNLQSYSAYAWLKGLKSSVKQFSLFTGWLMQHQEKSKTSIQLKSLSRQHCKIYIYDVPLDQSLSVKLLYLHPVLKES